MNLECRIHHGSNERPLSGMWAVAEALVLHISIFNRGKEILGGKGGKKMVRYY
jgi:hypothetical protein